MRSLPFSSFSLLLFLSTMQLLISSALSVPAVTSDDSFLTCFKCLSNDTDCRNTCVGKYCYKISFEGDSQTRVKKGCVNRTDALSKLNECSPRHQQLPGGSVITETICLCATDRCNGSVSLAASILSFFASIIAYFWKD